MRDTVFSPAFGNKPGTLVGRSRDMKCLADGLSAMRGSKERARLIMGQRGLGKTVLLLELAEYARSHGYITASPTVVAGGMLERILEKLEKDGEPYFEHDRTRITGGTVGLFGFSAGIQTETGQEPKRSFAYRLSEFCGKAEAAGKGVLILVDEVQANNEELKQLIIAYQEMVGEGRNIALVFAGLPSAISKALNEHVLTFFNRAAKMLLEPIALPEIEIYYRSSFEKLGIIIPDERIMQAAGETGGSPYMMQLIGHYITVSASDRGELSEPDFLRALEYAREEFITDICETTLAPLSEKDTEFLKAMSEDDRESAVKSLAERLRVDTSYIQRYKSRLMQAGIITQTRRGFVGYAVPYLREYFRRGD